MTAGRWLAARADEMAELLERLVAIDTENPPGRGLRECASALSEAMDELGLAPEVIELPPAAALEDEPRIVRGTAGDGPHTVYFHGHFDVVPAQRRDQFEPERRDGTIVGRGSADMKGGLVSMLYAAAAARELGGLDGGRVVLHLVCDEETGSAVGSGHLRDAGLIDPAAVAMLTPEPTGGVVWHSSRGAITLRVEVGGREAHVGQADLGINAFDQMVRIAGPLADLSRELLETRRSMLVVGGAAGAGANFNVVPGSAWFSVDRRFNPDEDLDEELARLTGTIERPRRPPAPRSRSRSSSASRRAPPTRAIPAAQALSRCIAEVEGAPARLEVCPGSLDTRWYAQLGVPAFGYGPGRLDVSHGPGEFIEEAAMRRCAEVYALFAGSDEILS